MPLRDGVQLTTSLSDGTTAVVRSPVTNSVAGAIEIQELIDRNEWAAESGDPAAYARHLRLKPLAGVPRRSLSSSKWTRGIEWLPTRRARRLFARETWQIGPRSTGTIWPFPQIRLRLRSGPTFS